MDLMDFLILEKLILQISMFRESEDRKTKKTQILMIKRMEERNAHNGIQNYQMGATTGSYE